MFYPAIFTLLLALFGVVGDYFIKLSGQETKTLQWEHFAIGLIIYASSAFGWFYVMRHIKLSSLGIIYSLSTVLLLVVIGIFYFHEQINAQELIGIVLAVTSLILLSRFA